MAPSFAPRERRSSPNVVSRATVQPDRPQTKLRVGSACDPAERQADQMADAVMARLSRPAVADDNSTWQSETRIRRSSSIGSTVGADGGPVDSALERDIQRARGGGSRLGADVRGAMETGFGASFGDVRIHTGSSADALNRSLNARAFTIGGDVFFAGGEYQPQSEAGQRLLAHELAHTVQQGATGTTAARTIRRFARDDVGRPTPNLDDAIEVRTIDSGQCVFFLEDAYSDIVLVKGDNVPVGVNQLFATVLHQVTDTKSIKMTPLPSSAKQTMKGLLADDNRTGGPSWVNLYNNKQGKIDNTLTNPNNPPPANVGPFGGTVPANGRDRARLFHMEQIDFQPKLVAMTKAEGQKVGDVMKPSAGVGGAKTARDLFGDPQHMEKLGMITAVDLFLGNGDRVVSSNFGNWFVDTSGKITLIDNVDQEAGDYMWEGNVADGLNPIRMLAKGSVAGTAQTCVGNLIDGMRKAGDGGVDQWAGALYLKKNKTRREVMEAAFLNGLNSGKARLVKLYATQKWRGAGRMAKRVSNAKQAEDTGRNDQPDAGKDYWETLKARARWLKAN